jgi:threonine dehydratase
MTPIIHPTTWIESPRLNRCLGTQVVLASETFQRTGSFKFRAAYHLASHVHETKLITASSGNFGQALACACQMLGKRCLVVMPHRSAPVKIDAVRAYGGHVELTDTRLKSRAERVAELAAEHPDAYVASAYDDTLVIAGNATLGAELARSDPPFDAVLAPVGGGGLASGLITGLRQAGCASAVIGVEPTLANDASRSLQSGTLLANPQEPDTIADGVRTLSLGNLNWAILRSGMERIFEVTEQTIADAVRLLFTLANLKAEPTGALPIAALLAHPLEFKDRRICCVISGGNVDPQLYARLLKDSTSRTPVL